MVCFVQTALVLFFTLLDAYHALRRKTNSEEHEARWGLDATAVSWALPSFVSDALGMPATPMPPTETAPSVALGTLATPHPPTEASSSVAKVVKLQGGKPNAASCAKYGCGTFNRANKCQCNAECVQFNSCCSDHAKCPRSGLVPTSGDSAPHRTPASCAKYGCGTFNRANKCQCNAECVQLNNCCSDYVRCPRSGLVPTSGDSAPPRTTGSCAKYGCGTFNRANKCQCNAECAQFNSCCSDYHAACPASDLTHTSTPHPLATETQARDIINTIRKEDIDIIKGIAYKPIPLKTPGQQVMNDDFWSTPVKSMWGSYEEGYRGDLQIMQEMGVNLVRLYGNDPKTNHAGFLNHADELGVRVVPGISDWPYTQMPGNCVSHDCNCFEQIKDYASQFLDTGVLVDDFDGKSYHPNLQALILINEPELKIVSPSNSKGYIKAIISALDAFLEVEKIRNITGDKPMFTATFSFQVHAGHPKNPGNRPGITQMIELEDAIRDPARVGYTPKNDLLAAYNERFIHSFNTANSFQEIKAMFLGTYQELFGSKPVFIGEFHRPNFRVESELKEFLETAEDPSNPFIGAAFFEWQVGYDKGGSAMDFGMFGLGDQILGEVELGECGAEGCEKRNVYCLTAHEVLGEVIVEGVANAYGGQPPYATQLC